MSISQSMAALEFFKDLDDPEQKARDLYPLQEIILVTVCAAICGADGFSLKSRILPKLSEITGE